MDAIAASSLILAGANTIRTMKEDDIWRVVHEIPRKVPVWFPISVRRWLAGKVGKPQPWCWACLEVTDANLQALGSGQLAWVAFPPLPVSLSPQPVSSCSGSLGRTLELEYEVVEDVRYDVNPGSQSFKESCLSSLHNFENSVQGQRVYPSAIRRSS